MRFGKHFAPVMFFPLRVYVCICICWVLWCLDLLLFVYVFRLRHFSHRQDEHTQFNNLTLYTPHKTWRLNHFHAILPDYEDVHKAFMVMMIIACSNRRSQSKVVKCAIYPYTRTPFVFSQFSSLTFFSVKTRT